MVVDLNLRRWSTWRVVHGLGRLIAYRQASQSVPFLWDCGRKVLNAARLGYTRVKVGAGRSPRNAGPLGGRGGGHV